MFTDAVVDLVEAGVVTGARKERNRGKIVSAFMMGTRRLYDFVNDNPMVEMRSVDFTNDTHVIRSFSTMTAINSAIEVDLTGQVVADSIGSRIYSGVGGQMDFVRGAALAPEGRAIIALPSTAANGTVSRITPALTSGRWRGHDPGPCSNDRDRMGRGRAVRPEPPRAGSRAHRDRPSRPSRSPSVGGAPTRDHLSSAGDDDRGGRVRCHVLRDAALEHPRQGPQTARADDDHVVATVLGDPLDRHGGITCLLDQHGLDAPSDQELLGLGELGGMDRSVIPRIDRHPTRVNRNDADDGDLGGEPLGELGGELECAASGVPAVVGEKDLHLTASFPT